MVTSVFELNGSIPSATGFMFSVQQVATPTFSPVAGTYTSTQMVTITCTTPSSTIYYTTNGSTPTIGSAVYSTPVSVAATETINAIAIATGYTQSIQGSAAYIIESNAATPTFSPVAGTYTSTQSVTISCSTGSSTIYYTTNGTTPTTGSAVYSTAVSVASTETLKAIATASGFVQSAVGSAAYTINTGGGGATSVFNYANFASSNGSQSAITLVADDAQFSGNIMQVCFNGGHNVGSGWYKTLLNISSFSTQFTFQFTGPTTGVPTTAGMTFCVQNSNLTTDPNLDGGDRNALFAAGDANLCGYGAYPNQVDQNTEPGIGNSIAVKFEMTPNNVTGDLTYVPGSWTPNQTGLYTNGGPSGALVASNDLHPYGINLYAADVMACTIVYDGTLLTMVLQDTTTLAQGRYVWPVNIPLYINMTASGTTNMAYIGFTGGTVTEPSPQIDILSWSFATGYNTRLATPTFSPTPGEYSGTQTVTISYPGGSTCYYTTNGLLPTAASTQYTGTISVSANEVIQAVAIQSGFTDSLVGIANYQIGNANLINFSSFGANDGMILCGYSYLNSGVIQLTDVTGNSPGNNLGDFEVSAAWFAAPVPISSFHAAFSMKFANSNSNGTYGLGSTFCIQNQPTSSQNPTQLGYISGGPTTLGADAEALGYGAMQVTTSGYTNTTGGIQSSVAIKFDLSDNSTGLYENGAMPTATGEIAITGVTLNAGNLLHITLVYNGTTLTLSITDTITSGNFTHNFTVNIPSIVDPSGIYSSNAYVGFTASSGYWCANQTVSAFTYTSP